MFASKPLQIFALTPDEAKGPSLYHVRDALSGSQEKAVVALARATLDYHALSSVCIFVGKPTDAHASDYQTIEVIRTLHGVVPAPGSKVKIARRGSQDAVEEGVARKSKIYFIRCVGNSSPDESAPTREGESPLGGGVQPAFNTDINKVDEDSVYYPSARMSTACEAEVLAALKRRDNYASAAV